VAARADEQAEAYRRGRDEGLVWAGEFATPEELRDLVQNPGEHGRDADVGPYWRGFVAGAEEVLDDAGPV
jgi:hypothetical protein